MIKLITPPGILVTVALLAIYVAWALQIALIEKSWLLAAAAAVALIACMGTALMKSWSRYLVYLITAGFIGKWCLSMYDGLRAGYFDFQFGSSRQAILSLAPGPAHGRDFVRMHMDGLPAFPFGRYDARS